MTAPIDVRDRDPYAIDQFDVKAAYRQDLEHVLVSHGEIRDRVARLATDVSEQYADGDLYPVCVLKGAIRFYVDLLRELDVEGGYREAVVHASRYHGGAGSEQADVRFFDPEAIEGRNVVLVEDILDQGHTLASLLDRIEEHDPASVEVAALFDKAERREVTIDPAFRGFVIPDEFVVGYGLDYAERFRDVPHLATVDPDAIDG
jgi:hypoxanthine phosphoribosyltransferase